MPKITPALPPKTPIKLPAPLHPKAAAPPPKIKETKHVRK